MNQDETHSQLIFAYKNAKSFDRDLAFSVYKQLKDDPNKLQTLFDICFPLIYQIRDFDWKPNDLQEFHHLMSIELYALLNKANELHIPSVVFINWLVCRLKFALKKVRTEMEKSISPPISGGIDVKTSFYDANTLQRINQIETVSINQKLTFLPKTVKNTSRLPKEYDVVLQKLIEKFVTSTEMLNYKEISKLLKRYGNPLDLTPEFLIAHAMIIARMKIMHYHKKGLVKSATYRSEWIELVEAFCNYTSNKERTS